MFPYFFIKKIFLQKIMQKKNTTILFFKLLLLIALMQASACKNEAKIGQKLEVINDGTGQETTDNTPVPAEMGGEGFEQIAQAQGWITSTIIPEMGDPKAVKGGSITMAFEELPKTLCKEGKESNTAENWLMASGVYESLLGVDPKTQDFLPSLATHWRISADKSEYEFRIDPNARWADGKPVVAADVLATFNLLTDEGIQQPATNDTYLANFEQPVAVSKYIVKVKLKKPNWRAPSFFAGMSLFPAHVIEKTDGAGYIKKFQYEMLMGTGPYEMDLNQSKQGEIIVLKRRPNYWAENYPRNKGANNFDEWRFIAVSDERLQLEQFLKGEYDFYIVRRAQWWKQEITANKIPEIKRGLIQRIKAFNFEASGSSYLAFNLRQAPFNDIKVRKAIELLWNFDELNNKMFFNEYARTQSYFGGTIYANTNNRTPQYNPNEAVKLLSEAGWKKKAGEKWLSKEGKIFEIDLEIQPSQERLLTPFQADLEKVGIKLNLAVTTPQAAFQNKMERKFKITFTNWGGMNVPNPETSMHSKFADKPDNNNLEGIANPEIDKWLAVYDTAYSSALRVKSAKAIDSIAFANYYGAMAWIAPYNFRAAYWNKFSYPKWAIPYSSTLSYEYVLSTWWYDKEKAQKVEQAKKDEKITFPINPEEVDYWGRLKK